MFNLGDRIEYLGIKATVIESLLTGNEGWVMPDDCDCKQKWIWCFEDEKCMLIENEPLTSKFLEIAARHFSEDCRTGLHDLENGVNIAKHCYAGNGYAAQIKTIMFNGIYQVMVDYAGLLPRQRESFINAFAVDHEITEYRLNSDLGYGGKFRNNNNGIYVDCYSEDMTKKRSSIIKKCNKAIEPMKVVFDQIELACQQQCMTSPFTSEHLNLHI